MKKLKTLGLNIVLLTPIAFFSVASADQGGADKNSGIYGKPKAQGSSPNSAIQQRRQGGNVGQPRGSQGQISAEELQRKRLEMLKKQQERMGNTGQPSAQGQKNNQNQKPQGFKTR